MKREDMRHILAVGTSDKHSVMLAIILALHFDDKSSISSLRGEARDWGIQPRFDEIMSIAETRASSCRDCPAAPPPRRKPELPRGVELSIICGKVPVVGLDKMSILHEHVAWLLQTITGTTGKADALFEYCEDSDADAARILRACCEIGLKG